MQPENCLSRNVNCNRGAGCRVVWGILKDINGLVNLVKSTKRDSELRARNEGTGAELRKRNGLVKGRVRWRCRHISGRWRAPSKALDSHRNDTYRIAVTVSDKAGKTGIKGGDFPASLQCGGHEQSISHLPESLDTRHDLRRQVMH